MRPSRSRRRAPNLLRFRADRPFCALQFAPAASFAGDAAPAADVPTPAPAHPPKVDDKKAVPAGKSELLKRLAAAPKPAAVAAAGAVRLVRFEASAFPYDGEIPDQGKPFLDVTSGERHGHTSPRGGVLWADRTYTDKRTLLFVPKTFDPAKPAVIIVYFHGNLATLERDVRLRQRVPQQVAESGLNAVLVAPQLAINALDSSAGHFWEKGFFARFLDEAAVHLSEMSGVGTDTFRTLPVVIVAYSGGYLPAIYSAERGGASERLRGVVLLDALFGEADRYGDWIGGNRAKTFFFSAYSRASGEPNARLRSIFDVNGANYVKGLPAKLNAGTIGFLPTGEGVNHNDFATHAWTGYPLKAVLARIAEFHTAPEAAAPPLAFKTAPR